jgi:hypothetical protein
MNSLLVRTAITPRSRRARRACILASMAILSVQATQLTVQWDDNSTEEEGFAIERTLDGNTFVEVGRVPANVTTFVDSDVAPASAVWYRVTAYKSGDRSASSNVAGSLTPFDSSTTAEVHWQRSGVVRSKLMNLSARAIPGSGERSLIVGFVVKSGGKSVLLRAVGPGLAPYMSSGTLQDPSLTVKEGDLTLLANDDWGGTERLRGVFNQLGAFPLAEASRDAALLGDFSPRSYTVFVTGAGSGYAMAEIYDADMAAASPGRLVNLSVRAQTGIGDDVLIVGFVVAGSTPLRVLIRGAGPALYNLGVTTALADPQLELFRGNVKWDHNNDWKAGAMLDNAFVETGAFRWPISGSKDAAMAVILPPGAYTALVSGVRGASGVALAEVYELP